MIAAREHALKTLSALQTLLPPEASAKVRDSLAGYYEYFGDAQNSCRHKSYISRGKLRRTGMIPTESSHVRLVFPACLRITPKVPQVRQESNFFYLTGWNISDSSFMICVGPSELSRTTFAWQSTLFIPKEEPLETMWSPPPPTLEAARSSNIFIDAVEYNSLVQEKLTSLVKSNPDAVIHTLPAGPWSAFPRLHTVFSDNGIAYTSKYLLSALHKARLIKTPYEIELMRKANAISSRAHELIMRLLGKHAREDILGGVDEGKLTMPNDWRIEREAEGEAVFVAACRREG